MGPPPATVRLLVLTPVAWVGSLAAVVVAPAVLAVAALADLLDRKRWRHLRLVALGVAFCALELAALTAAFGIWLAGLVRRSPEWVADANQRLLAWWLGAITAAMRRLLGFSFDVRFPDTGEEPLVVLSRHAGPGDALFLMDELANRQGRRIRAVGKTTLLWDPFFDHVAARAGYVFLPPGDPAALDAVRAAAAMPPRGAFISFPEGGNFTAKRRRQAADTLRGSGHPDLADAAEALHHLLLPRPGGVHAALVGSPEATVVFVAHSGFDDLDSLAALWRAMPEGRTVRLEARAVPRPEGWERREVLTRWLQACWTDMDRWIDKHSTPGGSTNQRPAPEQPRPVGEE